MRLTLAITGASGALFCREMLGLLAADARVQRVDFIASDASLRVLAEELGITGRNDVLGKLLPSTEKFRQHAESDIGAGPASGTYLSQGMIILPCSMGTLAGVANGLASNLIERAADVTLKEKRPLVLCVRETPFNRIHLRNMTLAAEAGAAIFPVLPSFYNHPATFEDAARQFCCRVLAHIGLPQADAYAWGE